MKKIIVVITIILFIFTSTGCGSNNKVKGAPQNNVPSEEKNTKQTNVNPPQNLPVYPNSKRFGDVKTFTYNKNTYLEWYYESTASGNEIVEFFKAEFQNMGFEIWSSGTYVHGSQFAVTVSEPGVKDKTICFVSSIDSEDLSNDVDEETPGRQYSIRVNIDQWNN